MITLMCVTLINQALYGPLADIPIESIGQCSGDTCVVYWVKDETCEVVSE